jgi:hypothetical protein
MLCSINATLEEELHYKPETTLLCVKLPSKNVIAHRFPIETINKPEELPNQLSFELLSHSLLKQLCDPIDNL